MAGDLTIRQARLVLPDRVVTGDVVIRDGTIAEVGPSAHEVAGEVIDGTGKVLMPGAIDAQALLFDPEHTDREDLGSGSRAAAAGGITSFLHVPDTHTHTLEALDQRLAQAAATSAVHFGFFIGATAGNLDALLAARRSCGIHVDLDAQSGLSRSALGELFSQTDKLVQVGGALAERLVERRALYGDDPDVDAHGRIHDVETAVASMRFVLEQAHKHGNRVHLAALSSEEEVSLLAQVSEAEGPRRVTAGVLAPHLVLDGDTAYATIGARALTRPPVRPLRHQEALWQGLRDGSISLCASGHRSFTRAEKAAPYPDTGVGIPSIESSLPLLLHEVNEGRCTLHDVVNWMCAGPAVTFGIPRKGRLEVGFDGDVVLVDLDEIRTLSDDTTISRAGWTPFAGWEVQGWPVLTAVLGRPVYRDGHFLDGVRGRELTTSK